MYILEGFSIGLLTLFVVGPVLFVLINATITDDKNAGFSVAIGIFISDLLYAILTIYGINTWLKSDFLVRYLGLIGFVILFIFGMSYLLKKEIPTIKTAKVNSKTLFQNFLKGFGINFFNPFAFGFWVLMQEYGSQKYTGKAIYFLLALVLGILVIDFIKVLLAKKLIPLIKSEKIFIFYKVAGVVMLLFSLRMLFSFLHFEF